MLTANISRDLLNQTSNATVLNLMVFASDNITTSEVMVNVLLCDCSGVADRCGWNFPIRTGTADFGVRLFQYDKNGYF